jgi:hypothetical protein
MATKRLTRENKSYQETLSPADIKKKLEEYQQVDNIDDVKLNTHIRYFTFNPTNGKKQFRLGGFLTKIDEKYVVLSNGKLTWSVQKKNTVFFMKVSFSELKQEIIEKTSKKYENEISKLKIENEHLKNTLKKLKREIKK